MSRVKSTVASRRKKKRFLKAAKGFRGGRSRLIRTVKEAVYRSMAYSFRDRRAKKRDYRSLWIVRINAGTRQNGISYSLFINGLKKAGVTLNRKVLAELAVNDPQAFAELAVLAKKNLQKA